MLWILNFIFWCTLHVHHFRLTHSNVLTAALFCHEMATFGTNCSSIFQLDSFVYTQFCRSLAHSILFSFFIICFECICYIFDSAPLKQSYHLVSLSMCDYGWYLLHKWFKKNNRKNANDVLCSALVHCTVPTVYNILIQFV